ncbi:MAG: RidA family protein [Streptomycetaceae bacterium]|jgi:enamine deaminase RidA (YjgF/YER057c/UK114 family)|uniref:RidA family protein n=1 Tax=Yinghuangia aomiensis TaxID=676205 RepID=A0ABP9H338_9ACTN|nr:RidA family protein [Streptomycetaceae bacterium]
MTGGVERISSGGPYEDVIGYSRAVAAGDFVLVSGCTSVVDGVFVGEGDPFEQTLTAFGIAEKALQKAGLSRDDVVRTRMYITHARDADEVGRAHKAMFDTARPAATMVVVAGLIDSRMLVEVEVEAYRGAK